MKTVACLGLLVLLLSHSLGWSVAVLFAGKAAATPRQHEAMQSEASAWHRFAELSERVQEMQLAKAPVTPLGSALKMLGDLAKTYLPGTNAYGEWPTEFDMPRRLVNFADPFCILSGSVSGRTTPPPEKIG